MSCNYVVAAKSGILGRLPVAGTVGAAGSTDFSFRSLRIEDMASFCGVGGAAGGVSADGVVGTTGSAGVGGSGAGGGAAGGSGAGGVGSGGGGGGGVGASPAVAEGVGWGVGVDVGAGVKPKALANSVSVNPFKTTICPSSFSIFVTGVPAKLLETASISVSSSLLVSKFFSSN